MEKYNTIEFIFYIVWSHMKVKEHMVKYYYFHIFRFLNTKIYTTKNLWHVNQLKSVPKALIM